MSYQTDCLYDIYEAVLIFHFYVINIVPAPRAQGAHPHTPKATQICELDLEFDQGLFTLLICLSVKTVSQVSKQQSVTVRVANCVRQGAHWCDFQRHVALFNSLF